MTPNVPRIVPARYSELIEDLKTLRKGRGIFTVDIQRRVGPALRQATGVDAADGPAETRTKVARRLQELADALPTDLRAFALSAFAIALDSRQPLYKERVNVTAARIGRDPRTVRRRMDDALVQLAQLATARPDRPAAPPGETDWVIDDLAVSLVLDRPRPELVEQARVVAQRDGLTELTVLAGRLVSYVGAPLRDIGYGGLLDGDQLRLSHPVEQGDVHEYSVRDRFPSLDSLRPRLVCTPTGRCDRFVLHIRFDHTDPPAHVWRIGDDAGQVVVDRLGEVRLEFTDLDTGRDYGAQW